MTQSFVWPVNDLRMCATWLKLVTNPHHTVRALRKALLTQPGVEEAFDALKEQYTALHALWDARQAAGLPQADVAVCMGTTVSAVSRLESSLRREKNSPSLATLRNDAHAGGQKLVIHSV